MGASVIILLYNFPSWGIDTWSCYLYVQAKCVRGDLTCVFHKKNYCTMALEIPFVALPFLSGKLNSNKAWNCSILRLPEFVTCSEFKFARVMV